LFAYHIRVSNEGEETAQLVSREWIINDADGHVERVKGPGVVGEQPVLSPGEAFEYTSFCPLKTSVGSMHGSYQMVTAAGDAFDAVIAPFTLATPHALN
jgi:ApaG protein